jgi:DNA-binding transcriptional MerR regulator
MESTKKEIMQIGEVANLTNTTIRTVRYYLQEGLIRATDRSQGGFYLFDKRTVETVRYICHLRDLGLSLSKIKELIDIRRESKNGGKASRILQDRLEEQLEFIEKKLKEYSELKREISKTIQILKNCEGCKSNPNRSVCSSCSVLSELEDLPSPMKAIY